MTNPITQPLRVSISFPLLYLVVLPIDSHSSFLVIHKVDIFVQLLMVTVENRIILMQLDIHQGTLNSYRND